MNKIEIFNYRIKRLDLSIEEFFCNDLIFDMHIPGLYMKLFTFGCNIFRVNYNLFRSRLEMSKRHYFISFLGFSTLILEEIDSELEKLYGVESYFQSKKHAKKWFDAVHKFEITPSARNIMKKFESGLIQFNQFQKEPGNQLKFFFDFGSEIYDIEFKRHCISELRSYKKYKPILSLDANLKSADQNKKS